MNLGQIRRNSVEDVRAFLREHIQLDLGERHVLIRLFDDFKAGVQAVDTAIAELGVQLTGEPAD